MTTAHLVLSEAKDLHLSPPFVGRAVVALVSDPDVMRHSGDLTSSWELAREYGFTDADGARPDWGAHWVEVMREMPALADGLARQSRWLRRVADRVDGYVSPR